MGTTYRLAGLTCLLLLSAGVLGEPHRSLQQAFQLGTLNTAAPLPAIAANVTAALTQAAARAPAPLQQQVTTLAGTLASVLATAPAAANTPSKVTLNASSLASALGAVINSSTAAAPAPARAAAEDPLSAGLGAVAQGIAQAVASVVGAVPPNASRAQAPGPAASRTAPSATLFVLNAAAATLTVANATSAPGNATLVLQGASPFANWFEDRPSRRGGSIRTSDLLGEAGMANGTWSGRPNATLSAGFSPFDGTRLRITIEGPPTADATNTTLTFNVTLPAREQDPVQRYAVVVTGAAPDGGPKVETQAVPQIDNYRDVSLSIDKGWKGWDDYWGGLFVDVIPPPGLWG